MRTGWSRDLAAVATAFVVATGAYVGFLAWDTRYYRGTDGYLHGPY